MCKKCQKILLKDSVSTSWEKAKYEWGQERVKIKWGYCICGEYIKKQHLMSNPKTNKSHWVGRVCVKTIFKDNKKLLDKIIHYTCRFCEKKLARSYKEKHKETEMHKSNVLLSKTYRQCDKCRFWNIDRTKPHWCTTCYDCFQQSKGNKKCRICKKYKKIGDGFLNCYNCYILKREITLDDKVWY